MAIISLEEFQTEAYDDTVGAYTFECECMGAVSDEQPELIAKKPGITLHLLRYGLFNEEAKKSYKEVKARQEKGGEKNQKKELPKKDDKIRVIDGIELPEVVVTPKEPRIKGYRYGYTSLREGYVYILDESDLQNKFLEYKVDELGSSVPIIWKKGSTKEGNDGYYDIREPEGGDKAITMEQDSVLWIAFSPVQWTVAYHKEMRSNAEKREERMEKIICSGFRKGQASPYNNAFPYDEIRVHFNQSQLAEPQWLSHKLDQMKADDECANPDDDLKEDMFIILADPISCADDIAEDLNKEFLRLRAMLESMQTGVDDEIIYERILREEEQDEKLTEEQEQISYLFGMALTSYQLIYNDDQTIKEYDGGEPGFWNWETAGKGASKDKLIKVLGIKERKDQREVIKKYRDAFGSFLESDYYNKSWKEYVENINCRILDGLDRLLKHLRLLAIHPHSTDKHLDLKRDDETTNDKWNNFLTRLCKAETNDSISGLLETDVDWGVATEEAEGFLDKNKIIDLSNKAGGVVYNLVETFGQLAFKKMPVVVNRKTLKTTVVEVESAIDMIFPRFRSLKVYGVEVFEVRRTDLNGQAKEAGFKVDRKKVKYGKFKYGPHKENVRMIVTNQIVLKERFRGKTTIEVPVKKKVTTTHVEIATTVEKQNVMLNSKASKAQEIFNSAAFQGAIGVLNLYNASVAVKDWKSEHSLKNFASLAAAASEITSTFLYFSHSRMQILGTSKALAKPVGLGAAAFGRISFGITSLQCLLDALDSFKANDDDAMLAWVGAGACFGYLTWVGFAFNPVTIVVGAVALVFVIFARYFSDTPLQEYFKNFALSDAVAIDGTRSAIKPWKYNKKLYAMRDDLIVDRKHFFQLWRSKEYKKWEDFKVAYQELLNRIVVSDITWRGSGLKNVLKARNVEIRGDIANFTVQVSFRQFLQHEDQFEYKMYYFSEGVGRGEPKELTEYFYPCPTLTKDKRGIPAAEVYFSMPDDLIGKRNENGEILFVCRFQIYDEEYYPYSFDSKLRWLGAKFDAYGTIRRFRSHSVVKKDIIQSNLLFRSNVRIDTLENLMTNDDWEILDNN